MNREEAIEDLLYSLNKWKPKEILAYAKYLENERLRKMDDADLLAEYLLILGGEPWPEGPTIGFCVKEIK